MHLDFSLFSHLCFAALTLVVELSRTVQSNRPEAAHHGSPLDSYQPRFVQQSTAKYSQISKQSR
jgi:hypothetical protein